MGLLFRLFASFFVGTARLTVALVRWAIALTTGAIKKTKHLAEKSKTMPYPHRYFWARMGPIAAAVVVVLALPFFFAATGVQPAVTGQSSALSSTSSPEAAGDHGTLAPSSPTNAPIASTTAGYATRGAGNALLPLGVILPNPSLTPGDTNPSVTQATIDQTICVSGWTTTVRPPSSYTTTLKITQLNAGYSYNGDLAAADYEEDHLISLELGGAPASVSNLWPEPYSAPDGARVKDKIENKLHSLVCSGALGLVDAQTAIRTDWWAAYNKYFVAALPSATNTPAPVATSPFSSTPAPALPPPASPATITPGAICADSQKGQSRVAANGKNYVCGSRGADAKGHFHWNS